MIGILTVTSVDTAHLDPSERFDFWHDLVARESASARISSAHAADFTASARVVDLGTVKLSAWRYPSLDLRRTARMISSTDPELYQLALPLSGRGTVTQQERTGPLDPGGFALIDTVRPHGSSHRPVAASRLPLSTLTALIPHSALPVPHYRDGGSRIGRIPADRGMGLLLAQFLRQVVDHPEQYAPADATRLDAAALALIAGTVAAGLGAEDALPAEVRAGGLRARIEAFVRRNLDDPALGPATVAQAHHLSVRSLHRLFEGSPTTVAALIRTLRLQRCRQDLEDRRLRHLSVRDIGRRRGFSDPAHFNRVFRAAYGISPGEHRQRSDGG
ncbi:helix-turn-helix domain-containing protein [Micromonospora endolithica]|uniref:AraC-like ligand-binding domain-containing protein n=1 Tax=Micromonospora endolithica TaxID=230091 RepID=UPI0011AC5937|nr:helix-turn-helix domain-containing protein [Micromonospora endolithica]TWJ20414.1 helix-turn-helix protein [Micromonospora endolithica]